MIRFTRKFPFIHYHKQLTADDYQDISLVIGHTNVVPDNVSMIAISKDQLIENRIPLNKIRFVTEVSFLYDVDNDKINPTYKVMLPKKEKNPIIEIGKPQNTMTVFLGENRTGNNYAYLKQILKKSKRGVALLIGFNYEEVMWLTNLDDAVDYYKESIHLLDYES
jgi:hypothetical protein